MATTINTTSRSFTAQSGTAAMANIVPVQYLGDKVYLLDPNTNPATVFFRKAKKRVVGDMTYKTQDDVITPEFSTILSAASATSWTVAASEGPYFAPWDIIYNKTNGAVVQVVSISSDTLTVDNAVTGVTYSSTPSAGDVILKLGNALEEGVGVPRSRTTSETTITNYIQRFSYPLRTTYPAKNAAYHYKGTDYDYQMKKKMLEMTLAQDLAFLLNGAPALDTPSTSLVEPADDTTWKTGVTMGLRYFIATYSDSALNRTEADLTEAEFYEWVKDAFVYGSSEKMLFASPLLIQAIMMWNLSRGRFEMKSSEKVPGLNFATVTTPHGQLQVVNHKGLRARTSADVSWNFIVDMENVGYVYFKGLDTQIWRDAVKDGSHQYVDELGAYCGTEFRLANTHAALKFTTFS